MTRPTPRRPASSRGGTQRPRKIAGQAPAPVGAAPADDVRAPAAGSAVPPDEQPLTADDAVRGGASPGASSGARAVAEPADEVAGRPGVLARQKTTRVLIATLVLVALALTLECLMLVVDKVGGDDTTAREGADDGIGAVSVPADRPVLADDLDVKAGVDAAAKAAQEIVAVDFQKFDDEVDKAADLMTARFAESYRTTTADIRSAFIANKTVVQATVVAQGVSTASRTRLQALVFLNQFVQRTRDGKPETVATPYRVLVTMVNTNHGWLVDGLATDVEKKADSGE